MSEKQLESRLDYMINEMITCDYLEDIEARAVLAVADYISKLMQSPSPFWSTAHRKSFSSSYGQDVLDYITRPEVD